MHKRYDRSSTISSHISLKKLFVVVIHQLGPDLLLRAVVALQDDGVLAVLVDEAGGDHLVDDASRLLAFLALLLELSDLCPHSDEFLLVSQCLQVLRLLLLFVLLDLLFIATALALRLHEVGTGTLAHYINKKTSENLPHQDTYSSL